MNKVNIKDLMKKYMDGSQSPNKNDAVLLHEQKIARNSTFFMPITNSTVVNNDFIKSNKDLFKKELLKIFSLTGSILLENVKSGFKHCIIDHCIEEVFVSYDYTNGIENKTIKSFEIVHKDKSKRNQIRYIYNSDLTLECINYQKLGQYGIVFGITDIDMCFSPNDEYYEVIIKAHILEEKIVKEVLPESIIPSAYKFDEDWKKRVELFKMMFL
jgi:hypothetical protein